ncbi:MAG: TRAP transporter large permease [Anaerovoracaceae bacterium]
MNTGLILAMFLIFFILLFLQVPIALCIGFASLFYVSQAGTLSLLQVGTSMFTACDSFPLMAVPLFILCGAIIEGGGLGKRLIDFVGSFVGHFTGGYAYVTVVACAFFGAISGSALATVAAIGGITVPVMIEAGYSKRFSYGLICASGCLGILIPPSIPLVMYGSSTGASVGTLFLGGFGPGILLAILLCIVAYFMCKKQGFVGNGQKFSWANVWKTFKSSIWALLIPVIILGGIYGGLFTPTEAAAVAVVYSIFAGAVIYRELTWKKMLDVIANAATTTGTILLVCATATVFGKVLTMAQVPGAIVGFLEGLTDSTFVILLIVNIVLLIVGCFMDTVAAIVILAPMLTPILVAYDINMIHFGLLMVLNLAIGLCTPPVGSNLFVACSIGDIKFNEVTRAVLPFLLVMLVSLILVTYIPEVSLFLPKLFGMIS